MKIVGKLLVILALLLGTAGCSTMKPVGVAPEFWENKQTKIAVVLHKVPEHGLFMKIGNQGLLDKAINGAMTAKLSEHCKTFKPDNFLKIQDIFADELTKAGFEVVKYSKQIVIEELPKIKKMENCYNRDFSEIFKETGCDNIIVLHLMSFGVVRTYRGFIPQTDPEGAANVYGLMVSKPDNKIGWYTGKRFGHVKEYVSGDWDQEPDYPNITVAAAKALEKSQTFLKDKFFGYREFE